jgi:ssRNA-specific RNase YbeY (16S rRNA maturation enzyme)
LGARTSASAAVEVVNRQRKQRIDAQRWAAFGQLALEEINRAERITGSHAVTIAFVGDRTIRRLNREHLGKDAVTDVLSFPAEPEVSSALPPQ